MEPPKEPSTQDKLALWLYSPKFWKGRKIIDFFVDVRSFIEPIQKTVKEKTKNGVPKMKWTKLEIFVEDVDIIGKQEGGKNSTWNLWNSSKTWKQTLGDDDSVPNLTNYLTKLVQSHDGDSDSVLNLLRFIRNKRQHYSELENKISVKEKQDLKWFSDIGNGYQFDDEVYGNFWNTKFPNVCLFLWTMFYSEKDKVLSKYYPKSACSQFGFLRPEKLYNDLEMGINNQINQGYVFGRFTHETAEVELEFQSAPYLNVQRILQESSVMVSGLAEKNFECRWYDKFTKKSGQITEKKTFSAGRGLVVVVTNTIHDIRDLLVEAIAENVFSAKRLVILLNCTEKYMNVSNYINQFKSLTHKRIDINELSDTAQNKVLAGLRIQGKQILLKELLEDDGKKIHDLIAKLDYEMLIWILRNKNGLHLCKKQKIVEPPKPYMERTFKKRRVVNMSELKHGDTLDKFVLGGLPEDKRVGKSCVKRILSTLRRKTYCLVQGKLSKLIAKEIAIKFEPNVDHNIHFLNHIKNDDFKWIYSQGLANIFENPDTHFEDQPLLETEFVQSLLENRRDERLVLLADQPGTGKSFILESAAYKIQKNSEKLFVIRTDFNTFLETFGDSKLTASKIVNAVCELVCSNELENKLMRYLIKNKSKNKYNTELMLDALDEVPQNTQKKAISILKILNGSEYFSHIWATMRKHMIIELSNKFGSYSYKLLPFSKDEQIKFLVDYWNLSGKKSKKTDSDCQSVPLHDKEKRQRLSDVDGNSANTRDFAKNVLDASFLADEPKIVRIPLQCRMLAEIYEHQVLDGSFANNDAVPKLSLVDLYGQLLQRKLDVYMTEKISVGILDEHELNQLVRQSCENINVYYAMKLVFPVKVANMFRGCLLSSFYGNQHPESFALRLGIVSNYNPLKFVHRTYAEFALAKFAFNVITKQFHHFKDKEKIFQTFFWKYILQVKRYADAFVTFRYTTICYFLNELLSKFYLSVQKTDAELISTCIQNMSTEMHYGELPFHFNAARMHRYNFIFHFLLTDKFETTKFLIWHHQALTKSKMGTYFTDLLRLFEVPVWQKYISNGTRIFHKSIINCIENYNFSLALMVEQYPQLLKERNREGEPPLFYFLKHRPTFKKKSYEDYQKLLQHLVKLGNPVDWYKGNKGGKTVFDLAVAKNHGTFLFSHIREAYRYFKLIPGSQNILHGNKMLLHNILVEPEWLLRKNLREITQLPYIFKFIRLFASGYPQIVEFKDHNKATPLLAVLFHFSVFLHHNKDNLIVWKEVLKVMIEDLKCNVNAVDEDENTALHFLLHGILQNFGADICLDVMKLFSANRFNKETWKKKNKHDETPLELARLDSMSSSKKRKILKFFKELGADFNE